MNLEINEIFYSLQGEGARAGTPTVFIRLKGCNAKKLCMEMGVVCDTEFESGRSWSINELNDFISQYPAKDITWTGGEPAKQLTTEIVNYFKQHGYHQSIETSGIQRTPENLDYICISPKVAEHIIERNFKGFYINELRYVRNFTQDIPEPAITADHYYLSPHSDGEMINAINLKHCIDLCLKNPQFKLSVQGHKFWKIQ